MPAVTVDMTDLERLLKGYRRRAERLHRLTPTVAEILVAAVEDVYEAEGPDWAPLAESTLRQRRGTTAKILQDTGEMAASTTPGSSGLVAEAFAADPKAEFHAIGAGDLPVRNPFDIEAFEQGVLSEVEQLLLDEVMAT